MNKFCKLKKIVAMITALATMATATASYASAATVEDPNLSASGTIDIVDYSKAEKVATGKVTLNIFYLSKANILGEAPLPNNITKVTEYGQTYFEIGQNCFIKYEVRKNDNSIVINPFAKQMGGNYSQINQFVLDDYGVIVTEPIYSDMNYGKNADGSSKYSKIISKLSRAMITNPDGTTIDDPDFQVFDSMSYITPTANRVVTFKPTQAGKMTIKVTSEWSEE